MQTLDPNKVTHIVIHCTDTPEFRRVSVAEVDRWHRSRGWHGIGYHFLIGIDGEVWEGRPLHRRGAHVSGHNAHTIGVAYVGGRRAGQPADTRTPMQKLALRGLIDRLRRQFPTVRHVVGHRDLNPGKSCPCYDVGTDAEK